MALARPFPRELPPPIPFDIGDAPVPAPRTGTRRRRLIAVFVIGVLAGFMLQLAANWFVPQIYMGPSFGKADLTDAEMVAILERGKNIHGYYARMPWRTRLMSGITVGENFDVSWVRAYDAIIERIEGLDQAAAARASEETAATAGQPAFLSTTQ